MLGIMLGPADGLPLGIFDGRELGCCDSSTVGFAVGIKLGVDEETALGS